MNNLLKYGIDTALAGIAVSKNLNLTTIRNTSKENLISKYGLNETQSQVLKKAVKREPIQEEILQLLLERNAFTCCLCNGLKSDAYIIHHIEHYNVSQDNSYNNLAVLCPNDHELAHREGEGLANRITPLNIKKAKNKWEKSVESNATKKSALEGEVHDLDYVNVYRILELALQINKEIPQTEFTSRLENQGLILNDGSINPQLYVHHNINPNTPLKFFAPFGSAVLTQHYYEILLETFRKVKLYDLDNLLKISELKNGIIGKFCFYSGGVYGRTYKGAEINKDSEPTIIHIRRKPFFVEWKVDPMYITSNTATWRIAKRTVYLVYGKILDVCEEVIDDEKRLVIDIRPYAFGMPKNQKNRKPEIHYRDIDYGQYE